MATGVLISDRIWHSENPIFYYPTESQKMQQKRDEPCFKK